MIHPEAVIHALAHVAENVTIGPRTTVWQFATVIRGAKIGEDCRIAATAVVDGAVMGNGCIISNGAHLNPGTWLANDVFVGPHVVLCNDTWPRTSKEGFSIDQIADLCVVKIEYGASLGANSVILPGVTVGQRAMVAAGAVVSRNVPRDCLYQRTGTIVKIDQERFARRIKEA